MSAHPIEALLRPPVELWSALVAGLTAAIAFAAPWALMMPLAIAWPTGAGLGALALWRAREALWVLRYQRNLRRLPVYALRAPQIPVSTTKLFLGRGFAALVSGSRFDLPGQTGLLVENREDIPHAIDSLLGDNDVLKHMVQNARTFAEEHFDIDKIAESYISLWSEF